MVALSLPMMLFVAREARGLLGDDRRSRPSGGCARDQRGARRRAERGGVDVVVAQAALGDAVHRGCGDDAAEGARHAETRVVGHDEKDVGRLLGRDDARAPTQALDPEGIFFDDTAELRVGCRELLAADGGRCAG